MAAITKPRIPARHPAQPLASNANALVNVASRSLKPLLLAALAWWLGRQGLWWIAAILIGMVEARPLLSDRSRAAIWRVVPFIAMGVSAALVITLLPKAAPQAGVALLYAAWRLYQMQVRSGSLAQLVSYLIVQASALQAIFLAAAIWNLGAAGVIVAVWLVCFSLTYQLLLARGDTAASLMAAVWALVAAQCAWLFTVWLVSYVAPAGLVIVPQPVLVLSALAYCFGGVYYAQRQGSLSRARLAEYLVIGFIILLMVISGTPWHATN